jgi:hypothetical protein
MLITQLIFIKSIQIILPSLNLARLLAHSSSSVIAGAIDKNTTIGKVNEMNKKLFVTSIVDIFRALELLGATDFLRDPSEVEQCPLLELFTSIFDVCRIDRFL